MQGFTYPARSVPAASTLIPSIISVLGPTATASKPRQANASPSSDAVLDQNRKAENRKNAAIIALSMVLSFLIIAFLLTILFLRKRKQAKARAWKVKAAEKSRPWVLPSLNFEIGSRHGTERTDSDTSNEGIKLMRGFGKRREEPNARFANLGKQESISTRRGIDLEKKAGPIIIPVNDARWYPEIYMSPKQIEKTPLLSSFQDIPLRDLSPRRGRSPPRDQAPPPRKRSPVRKRSPARGRSPTQRPKPKHAMSIPRKPVALTLPYLPLTPALPNPEDLIVSSPSPEPVRRQLRSPPPPLQRSSYPAVPAPASAPSLRPTIQTAPTLPPSLQIINLGKRPKQHRSTSATSQRRPAQSMSYYVNETPYLPPASAPAVPREFDGKYVSGFMGRFDRGSGSFTPFEPHEEFTRGFNRNNRNSRGNESTGDGGLMYSPGASTIVMEVSDGIKNFSRK